MNKCPEESDRACHFTNDHKAVLILYEARGEKVGFGCGFYCKGNNCKIASYTFSIFAIEEGSAGINADVEPCTVWSANRDRSVGISAMLELTMEGDLVVKDADGSVAWSAGTSGRTVVAMNLTDGGNPLLLDGKDNTIWQSRDYPMDNLLLGQRLRVWRQLAPRASPADQTQEDIFTLSVAANGLFAMVESSSGPSIVYYSMNFASNNSSCLRFSEGSLNLVADAHPSHLLMDFRHAWMTQFTSLGSDGHFRLYYMDLLGRWQ